MAESTKTKHPKEITLYIRVPSELKAHLQREAKKAGLPVSSWARMKLMEISSFTPEAV